jgi:hypothetical protein
MYSTNSERNRVIYELWEKNLTVDEASYQTDIPRSTVGYYYRKFNKLAAKGKPVVFPGPSRSPGIPSNYTQDIPLMSNLETRILKSVVHGNWKELYYRLNSFKLLKELGLLSIGGQASFLSSLERWLNYESTNAEFERSIEYLNKKRD